MKSSNVLWIIKRGKVKYVQQEFSNGSKMQDDLNNCSHYLHIAQQQEAGALHAEDLSCQWKSTSSQVLPICSHMPSARHSKDHGNHLILSTITLRENLS